MSEGNVALVQAAIGAWQQGDDAVKAFVREHYTADATWEPLADFPEAAIHRGQDEIIEGFMDMRHAFERSELRAEKLVDAADRVIVAMASNTLIKGTADELEMRWGNIYTVREGKITDIDTFRSFDEALEATGLSE